MTIGTTLNTFGNPFAIGARLNFSEYSDCDFAEVKVWQAPLTSKEVLEALNTFPESIFTMPNKASLLGYWPLHDGKATDYSGSVNTGTLVNSPVIATHPNPVQREQQPLPFLGAITPPPATGFGPLLLGQRNQLVF